MQKAAEQGHVEAQISLAQLYRDGTGGPEDWEGSLVWLRKAADAGDADAEFTLGDLYSVGFGEPRGTNDTCLRLFERSAAQDNLAATFALARR